MGTRRSSAREEIARHRLSTPVRWLLWLVAAAVASVVAGFVIGLARPRAAGDPA